MDWRNFYFFTDWFWKKLFVQFVWFLFANPKKKISSHLRVKWGKFLPGPRFVLESVLLGDLKSFHLDSCCQNEVLKCSVGNLGCNWLKFCWRIFQEKNLPERVTCQIWRGVKNAALFPMALSLLNSILNTAQSQFRLNLRGSCHGLSCENFQYCFLSGLFLFLREILLLENKQKSSRGWLWFFVFGFFSFFFFIFFILFIFLPFSLRIESCTTILAFL